MNRAGCIFFSALMELMTRTGYLLRMQKITALPSSFLFSPNHHAIIQE